MSEKYSIQHTHQSLKQKMIDYISTAYLGKNDDLRLACESDLNLLGALYQSPYIEASQAYQVDKNGIENLSLPDSRKTLKPLLIQLSEASLGVFKNPYRHQTQAIEAFAKEKDVFVATGTGSGKTECFMWPMVSKLLEEVATQPETWEERGVRTIMLYPMNALVSDQLGRLRKLIGDRENKFHSILNSISPTARVPQFGMYTGRTPYAGSPKIEKDKKLSQTIKNDLINQFDEETEQEAFIYKEKSINELIKLGKYPAKKNLEAFIEKLANGEHFTDISDVELITRQEIRQTCPDILVTNYSMLEYMLIRPIEESIWADTKKWLSASPNNKLLFIIDEAHMYRGSSGGEVALLIRRFMHKLEIDRDKIQFILTSASIPKHEMNAVEEFANSLTAGDHKNSNFVILTGEVEQINFEGSFEIDPLQLSQVKSDDLYDTSSMKIACIKHISDALDWKIADTTLSDDTALSAWLYEKLSKCKPLLRIILKCRGHATKYDDLCLEAFPNTNIITAQKATNILLSLAHMAKTPDGNVFLPTRLHLMFRGLKGIFTCSNPDCNIANDFSKKMNLGKIYLGSYQRNCKCGGVIYELVNDRTCGALFIKGYMDPSQNDFIWPTSSEYPSPSFQEMHFFILNTSAEYKPKKEQRIIWLESKTGKIIENDSPMGKSGYTRLVYSTKVIKEKRELYTFTTCPKCGKRKLRLSDFVTRGNESFFNLITEQFYLQPQLLFTEKELEQTPNAGRKVLLFSDSRQKAAILAKDLTRSADENAMRKVITLAAIELQEWGKTTARAPTLDLLYVAFLKVAAENNLRFFYGEDEQTLKDDILSIKNSLNRSKKRNRPFNFEDAKARYSNVPSLYKEQIIKQLCHSFRSLIDAALCYITPSNHGEMLEDILDELDEANVKISEEEFSNIFTAWACEIMIDWYAIGSDINDSIRGEITPYYNFGIAPDEKFSQKIKAILEKQNFSNNDIDIIYEQLKKYTAKGLEGQKHYLNLALVCLKYDKEQKWFKCPKCSCVFPITLWGSCARCGKGKPTEMTPQDYERIKFWRGPVEQVIQETGKKSSMTRINVEEHTAQLSHKDGSIQTWSTTEDFEMRFQNVYAHNDKPVDVLSCTTTMEVGIDIGSLTAVGLRNIPPMRENYQQRAGRAGRRGSSISTIVTYTDSGPYDSYYFFHPERIISGAPRKPWIDINNTKLVFRHLNSVLLCKAIQAIGYTVDKIGAKKWASKFYDDTIKILQEINLSEVEVSRLLPLESYYKNFPIEKLLSELKNLCGKISRFPENYSDINNEEKSLLNVFLEEGIFPTYSFPRNVVGFYIEDSSGNKIIEKPDRALEVALSEYAPGRIVVVNKKSYKSAGIYNFYSKFIYGQYEKPAEKFLNSSEYLKTVYYCENRSCSWQDITRPQNQKCPFCSQVITGRYKMVKPWGFAPLNGTSIREAEAESENSYATEPCYSLPMNNNTLIPLENFSNIRIAKLPDQPLTILNTGSYENNQRQGFIMCKLCGAIVPGNDYDVLKKISSPYKHPRLNKKCKHPESESEKVFLGHQLLTDMLVFEITIDNAIADITPENLWLKSAATTFSEALALAAGKIMDIEFTDIRSGYRIRYSNNYTYVDCYLFDNLSSGAGYSSALCDLADELLKETAEILSSCVNNCDTACHSCIKHFWNQQHQHLLDRKVGHWLFTWAKQNVLPPAIDYNTQIELAKPLQLLFNSGELVFEHEKIIIMGRQLYIYPAIWSKHHMMIPSESIPLSDKLIKNSLPKAHRLIRKIL